MSPAAHWTHLAHPKSFYTIKTDFSHSIYLPITVKVNNTQKVKLKKIKKLKIENVFFCAINVLYGNFCIEGWKQLYPPAIIKEIKSVFSEVFLLL